MKREVARSLSFATLSAFLLFPGLGLALGRVHPASSTAANTTTTNQAEHSEALKMVPARVAMAENLDARKAKPGDTFRTTLADKVRLKNGPELPEGTVILGVVATDNMQPDGTSKLALRFTKAELKNGTVIPIKATIEGVYPPEDDNADGEPVEPGNQVRHFWTPSTMVMDQIDALPGVDLHSQIASVDSGILVSRSKHDVDLERGSEVGLAVAPAGSSTAKTN